MREEWEDRPRQSQHGPLGKAVREGEPKPEKTLIRALALAASLEANIPQTHPSWGLGTLMGPEGRGPPGGPWASSARVGLPSPGSGGRWHEGVPAGCGRQNWVHTQPIHFLEV